jgi:hypothetical protein
MLYVSGYAVPFQSDKSRVAQDFVDTLQLRQRGRQLPPGEAQLHVTMYSSRRASSNEEPHCQLRNGQPAQGSTSARCPPRCSPAEDHECTVDSMTEFFYRVS